MINLPEVTVNFICKITIYVASREVMLVNLICDNNHEYKRLLAIYWHEKKRPTETMYSGKTKINYSEDFIHLSHDVMIYLSEFPCHSNILRKGLQGSLDLSYKYS